MSRTFNEKTKNAAEKSAKLKRITPPRKGRISAILDEHDDSYDDEYVSFEDFAYLNDDL